ncbi:MAG: protein kinase [Muribaculaceae bacterium]|nr:protein kinase [Muribaculaceae bacterium]
MSEATQPPAHPKLPDSGKWTEITFLPEWDEPFYDVYTAKKFGKWLMLKTLKKEYKSDPEYQAMLEREFEVRYNLAHPRIVMINDLEDVPGVGLSIITDDVYGDSLRKLIDDGKVTSDIIDKIARQLPEAIDYVQTNHIVHHPIRPETVIFTENIQNLKVIDVGFDQKNRLQPSDVADDIRAYGEVLSAALDACPGENFIHLRAVADRCLSPFPYKNVQQLQMAVAQRSTIRLYISIIIFLIIAVGILLSVIIFKP